MLSTFLIMLREGFEAALIVGIIATYLHRTGRGAWNGAVWLGVLLAIAASLFAGAGLLALRTQFPQRAQEGFEAAIGLIAVAVLLWMVFWMRRASAGMRRGLEGNVDAAFARPGRAVVWTLVGAAFLAVAREGLESVFFLLAIFQQSPGLGAPLAALAGLVVSAGLGAAIFRGGLRLDLRQFFRWTGVMLIVVAAGLFAGALRSLHEAGVWNFAQTPAWDLSRVLPLASVPGAVLSALVGYHDTPAVGEVVAWAALLLGALAAYLRPTARVVR